MRPSVDDNWSIDKNIYRFLIKEIYELSVLHSTISWKLQNIYFAGFDA